MRIDCEQCGAAFTIDDALISDRGVRAQCPKCGQQKVVKKPAGAAPATGFPSPPPSGNPGNPGNPFGPPPAAAGAPPQANPFASLSTPSSSPFGDAAPAAGNPFGAPAANPFGPPAAANPFGPPTANPFGTAPGPNPFGPPPAATASPFGSAPADSPFGPPVGAAPAPAAATANPFGAPKPFGAAADPFAKGAPDPFAKPAGAAPAADPFARAEAPDPFASRSTGANLSSDPFAPRPTGAGDPFSARATGVGDPFSARATGVGEALGSGGGNAFGGQLTDSHPRPEGLKREPTDPFSKAMPDAFARDAGSSAGGQWAVKTSAGDDVIDLAELRERIKAGAVRPDAKVGPVGEAQKPVKDWPLLAVSLPGRREPASSRPSGARAAGSGFSFPRPAAFGIVVIVLVGATAAGIAKYRPEWIEIKSDVGVNPLRRARPMWQRQFPEVEGTAEEHLVEGRKQMRLDTAAGYRKADDELRQALLLDVANVAAIAAWAENFSQLPTVRADLEGSTLALEALEYALKTSPENVELLRGQAALKLALGDVDDAQRILLKAAKLAPNDTDTLLVLAKSNLERNPTDALSIIQGDVRAKNPELKVAYVVEGAAQRRLGAFKESREMLEARLVSDPNNVGALKELAKLELDLGNATAAIHALTKLLDAEDKDVEAHLLRAKINYQIKGGTEGFKAADAQLSEVLAKHEGAAGDLLLSVLAHAAYVKSQLGDLDGAIALGERARATDPGYPSALFVLGRTYAQKGDLVNAQKTLEQAVRAAEQREQFYEPLVRSELAAVQARAGDEVNAIRNNEKVIDYDPRNLRAHFGLAASYVKNQKFTQAMTIIRRALASDPAWDRERLLPTDFPTPRTDLIIFADAFRDAQVSKDDESLLALKLSSEGMIRYHAGQREKAADLFNESLKADRYNHAALLYLSVMDMEDGQNVEPRRRLKLAVDTTAASHPVTRLYLARAELLAGQDEAARALLVDLVETEPTLVQARYSLAMVFRKQKLEAQATTELKAVVRQDPDYLPAKQALAEKL